MRLARLDLLRYGRFTGARIELPRAERDVHIVFGPNEAGKTTSLTAIEDLLFGIPERSPYNFLHSYDAMRVGAVLENGGERLEFQRRTTRRNMILGSDGGPLSGDERLLAPFLGGADRAYFDRMFNLSHDRLAEGGREILEAKDDVGQMLFAAGTGLADLRKRLKRLEQEADELWAPRRSGKRLYYKARDRLDDARSRQRDHSLTVGAWRTARKALNDAEKELKERREKHAATSTKLKKLVRIRRVHGVIRQRRDLKREISALGKVIELGEDAAGRLAEAERQDATARAQVDILRPQLEEARQELEAISPDESLVRRTDEITRLNEQRIAVRSGREDLPRRRHEYRVALESMARLAADIGWDFEEPGELIERMPSRGRVKAVRELLTRHRESVVELRSARQALKEAQVALQDKTARLEEIEEAADVSGLAAVLDAVRGIGDVAARIHARQGEVAETSERIEKKRRSMKPALLDGADIEALAVPPRDAVTAYRDDVRDWERRQEEAKRRLTEADNALESDQTALEQRVRDEGIVVAGAVEEARGYRDTLWNLVKARYIAGSEIPSETAKTHAEALEDLPTALESSIERADSVADRRFHQAEAAGELAVLARNIAGHETRLGQLKADEAALNAEGKRLDEVGRALWADVPIEPFEALASDVMPAWLEVRDEILLLIGSKRDAERQLADSRREEQQAIAEVRTALAKAGWDAEETEADSLRVLIERAEAYRREQETKAEKIGEMREAERSAKLEMTQRQGDLEGVKTERENWGVEWAKAVAAIDLACDEKPDVVSEQINVIDEMREHAAAARNLRDEHIAAIEQDIGIFERVAAEVASELAPDLAGGDADAVVVELDRRRVMMLKLHERHGELTEDVRARERKIRELEEGREAAWIPVRPLFEEVGVKDVEKLREAIERSDRLRELKNGLEAVVETLNQQADGLAIEALEEECRNVNIDEVRAKEEAAEEELKELEEQREEASAARKEAQKAFEAIGGDDAAARAAADGEEALAAMRDAAERYVRVRSSAMLLRWAVERYRTEMQGPLLKRASDLFRVLTQGSFERLEVRFDEREAMHLTGVRLDGEAVAVPGLSSGTEDQLFLALRIAAVEDYLERAGALPFVADDLFINFDAERSAAGFEVLGQLAERTQVLFYTHHLHLVEVARETLGEDVHVVTLTEAT